MPCPAEYRNLGLNSFGEQKYVTADMLRQFCKNDAYLKKMVDKLEYLTPPAVRKVFSTIPVEELYSYGYNNENENKTITFDSNTHKILQFDFNDLDYIDIDKTTAVRTSLISNNGVVQKFEVPRITESSVNNDTRNYSPWTIRDEDGNVISDDMTCNEFWYVGFDRNRHYETRPNWLQNMLNGEIPGISRAQTFKAKSTGLLESVVLNLQGTNNTGMPLIVQIRKTELIDGIYVPVDSGVNHLAYQEVKFNNTDPGVYSVVFDHPCTVEKNETYAIVVLSPLSHPTNCYWIGGWNAHCHADVYEEGNAFYSFNCGYTWIRYGKDDEEVDYHQGKYAPQDFAFQCHIKELKTGYDSSQEFYVYFKPIFANPIKEIMLASNCSGDTATEGHTLRFEVSQNGRTWQPISESGSLIFNNPTNVLFLRAIMKSNGQVTPYIEDITLSLEMEVPTEMYVRTKAYSPPLTGILSANVWGRIYAPFKNDPNTECTVEIIREKEVMEHFIIIDPTDLINYANLPSLKDLNIASDITGKSESQIIDYLEGKPTLIARLRNENLYIRGFITDFQFKNKPAYPTLRCVLQPSTSGELNVNYGEWYDYLVDYDENTLTFFDDILLPKGTLSVSYNPIFIEGLNSNEVGLREDGTEGLILDYFEENIVVSEDMISNYRIDLRAEPVDPIRKVVINSESGTANEYQLIENIDYHIEEQAIILDIVNFDGESPRIQLNDIITIVYTPNLDDNSISLGYRASRINTDDKVVIEPNYIEYKS